MDSKKKRTTSLSLSSRTAKPNLTSKRSSYVQISNCHFCQEKVSKFSLKYFFSMTNKALYSKYSSSQNYYYTKDINDILANAKVPSVIIFRDIEVFEECEEYLKRFYRTVEYDGKIRMLTEYYKYHQDIPRLFMYPIINTLNRYHDKKRRLDYLRITKMLKDQNNPSEENRKVMKGRDVRRSIKSDYIPITDRVLAELELTQSNVMRTKEDLIKVEGNWRADSQPKSAEKTVHSGSLQAYRDKLGMAINRKLMREADRTMEQMREASVSNTLHDLNMKLGEIINKSYSVNFENSEYQAKDNTISNLGNFLNYMHDNQQAAKLNRIPEITGGSANNNHHVKMPQPPIIRHEYYRSDAPEPESRVYASKNKSDFESLVDEKTRDISTGGGLNLAEKLLKDKPYPYNYEGAASKSAAKKVEPKRSVHQEIERPFTALAGASKMASANSHGKEAKGKSVPMTILKIQNFEEVMKRQQGGSPIKVNSQRSTSTEKYQKRPPSAISHRAYNAVTKESTTKKPASKSRQEEMMIQRRGSQAKQGDLTEVSNSSRMILKSRSSYNNIKEPIRTTEFSTLMTHQYNDPPNSHREKRMYVDTNLAARQNTTGNTSGRIVSTARTSQTKATIPTTMHNNMVGAGHERTKSMRTTPVLGPKDLRNMVGLCQINLHDASRDSKASRSSTAKTGVIRPVPQTSRLEYSGGGGSSNISPVIPEQEMLSFKRQFEKLNSKNSLQSSRENLTRHKSTKSDVRMFESGTLDLSKKVSPMQAPVSSRDRNQSPFELAKYERDNVTARPQIYNYNTNNIVNIFVNPATAGQEKSRSGIKLEPKRTGSLTERDRYASNSSSGGTGGVKIVSSKPMGSDVFMKYNNQQAKRQEFIDNLIKRDSTRESPVMILKKDDHHQGQGPPQVKLTRSKSGNLGSFVNNNYQIQQQQQNNNVVKSALHSKIQKKIELDLMEEMRSTPDSYEFLVNFRSKR